MRPNTLIIAISVLIVLLFCFAYTFDLFPGNMITGNDILSTRLVIVIENESVCDMNLTAGWNLVSFPCIYGDTDIETFLNGTNISYSSVRTYSAGDSADPWKSFNPSLPPWVIQDLSSFSRAGGYWLEAGNGTRLYVNSTLGTPTLIDMAEGWNLIGYPRTADRAINDTFGQLIPNFDYVYLYNASDPVDKWKQYTWNSSLVSDQDLNSSVRNYGYWIYMLDTDTLIIS